MTFQMFFQTITYIDIFYIVLVLILKKKSCKKVNVYNQYLNIWQNNWRSHNWQRNDNYFKFRCLPVFKYKRPQSEGFHPHYCVVKIPFEINVRLDKAQTCKILTKYVFRRPWPWYSDAFNVYLRLICGITMCGVDKNMWSLLTLLLIPKFSTYLCIFRKYTLNYG